MDLRNIVMCSLLQSQVQSKVVLQATPNSLTTPRRDSSHSSSSPPPLPDTPSRDVVLESEPRGAEFQVSLT